MRGMIKFGLTVVLGIVLGAAGMQLLRAQSKPPAYFIAEVETIDQAAMQPYGAAAPATIAAHGGKLLVRGTGTTVPLEGEPPKGRIVVIQFDSLDQAQGWYHSPEYQKILPIRKNATHSRTFIVEGASN